MTFRGEDGVWGVVSNGNGQCRVSEMKEHIESIFAMKMYAMSVDI
jgi:hypothetical protein